MNNNGSSDPEFRADVQEYFKGVLNPTMVGDMKLATDEVIASFGVDKLKEMIAEKKAEKKGGKKATKTKRNINKKGKKGKKTKKTKKRKGKTMKKRKY